MRYTKLNNDEVNKLFDGLDQAFQSSGYMKTLPEAGKAIPSQDIRSGDINVPFEWPIKPTDVYPWPPMIHGVGIPAMPIDENNKTKPITDSVNSPTHYNHNRKDIECIEAIEASMSQEEFLGYLKGNVIKYLWRYRYKNLSEDLKKAQWYLKKLTEVYSNAKA